MSANVHEQRERGFDDIRIEFGKAGMLTEFVDVILIATEVIAEKPAAIIALIGVVAIAQSIPPALRAHPRA